MHPLSSFHPRSSTTHQPTSAEPFHSTLDSVIKASSNSAIDALKPAAAGVAGAAAASKLSENSSANDFPDDCNVIENNLSKLRNEIWFHGPISRKESEILVYQDGDFLVRQSQTCVEQFVLTGMQDGVRKHLLLVDPEGVVSFFVLEKFAPNLGRALLYWSCVRFSM